jgi:diguanylate cyclase (GGDEF)-like protein
VSGRILLVDDDAELARFLTEDLRSLGHDVEHARSAAAVERAMLARPDLVVLDAGAHSVDVVRRLRADPLTAWLPVIVLSDHADAATKALTLSAGADDCVGKPFDPLELAARVEGTLRRSADIRSLSPLTGLPGNHRIEVEIAARTASQTPFAVCHVDLDDFKGFNDAYGFSRGDGLLLLMAACLHRATLAAGEPTPFLGHVGGDDFVVVCAPEQAERLCLRAAQEFAKLSLPHYDAADAARGCLETVDRRGETRRQPLVSVSAGVALHHGGPGDHRAVVAVATEMKQVAKREVGSYVAVDRRA